MARFRITTLVFTLACCSLSFGRNVELPLRLESRNVAVVQNDFENGATFPWFDNSPADVNWAVEDFDAPLEPTPAPRPNAGSKYLRVYRGTSGTAFGLAVFSSPYFDAQPGDTISLDFWIRSDHTGGNSLEVYYEKDRVEERLLNLGIFSSPSNFEWRTASTILDITEPTNLRLIIYGYCGSILGDSIAIDNIVVRRVEDDISTTPDSSTTVEENTNTATATTTTLQSTSAPVCSQVLNIPIGNITSPNYPGNYNSDTSCSWLIQLPEPYSFIKFDFIDFMSENCCDILRIYDGPTTSSPILLEHRGHSLPSPPSVTSSVGNVLITFVSDYTSEERGFWMVYTGLDHVN